MAAAPEQPKKPAGGAFGRFVAEKRPEFTKQCQGQPVSAISKLAGVEWKKLSEADRAPYQKLFEEAQKKYTADMEAFLAAGGVKQKGAAAKRADKKKEREEKIKAKEDKKEARAQAKADKGKPKSDSAPPAKVAKVSKEADVKPAKAAVETKKAEKPEKPEKVAAKEGKAKAKGKAKANANADPAVDIPQAVLEEAKKASMVDVLTSLLKRDDIKSAGIDAAKALKALQGNRGLLHPSRRALLGA